MSKSTRHDPRNPAAGAIRKHRAQDKRAANHQITAEQLIAESREINNRDKLKERPKLVITTAGELKEYRKMKRVEMETLIRRDYYVLRHWLRYAEWEEKQQELGLARAVFINAKQYHPQSELLWTSYARMEMRHGNVNKARNVLDEALKSLPTEGKLWMDAILLERTVEDFDRCRELFNSWMQYKPRPQAWKLFVEFEHECTTTTDVEERKNKVRDVLARFSAAMNDIETWIYYSETERNLHKDAARAADVLTAALQGLPTHIVSQPELVAPLHGLRAELLEELGQISEAQSTYKGALEGYDGKGTNKPNLARVNQQFLAFLGRHGTSQELFSMTAVQHHRLYEKSILTDPLDASAWLSLIALERSINASFKHLAGLFEQACFKVSLPEPSSDSGTSSSSTTQTHSYESRSQLLISYALLCEEAQLAKCKDAEVPEPETVYLRGLGLFQNIQQCYFPHELWVSFADFRIRQLNPSAFRDVVALSIKSAACLSSSAAATDAKRRLYTFWLQREGEMNQPDMCRMVHEQCVTEFPSSAQAWKDFAAFEHQLNPRSTQSDEILQRAVRHSALREKESIWVALLAQKIRRGDIAGALKQHEGLLSEVIGVCVDAFDTMVTGAAFGGEKSSGDAVREGENAMEDNDPELRHAADRATKKVREVLSLLTKFCLRYNLSLESSRNGYRAAVDSVKKVGGRRSALPLIEAWRDFEAMHGDTDSLRSVEELLEAPKKKRAKLFSAAQDFE